MDSAPNILIVIPLYNHASTVLEVISRCKAVHRDILVIDDGSTDLSENFFSEAEVKVIRHGQNRGKGAALMTGAKFATQKGYTHIICLDADLQHLPEDLPLFKTAILKDPKAVFVGKRDFAKDAATIPGSSVFGRAFSNFWFRVQTGRPVGDAQSGFRAYPLFVLNSLKLSQTHYDFEVEVLVKAAWAGVAVRDLDICVHYPGRGRRISHFKLLRDNLRLTHLNTLLTMRSFLPWPHKKIIDGKKTTKFSIFRPVRSIQHFLAHEVSPFEIALSGGVGVFLGTLPLIGIHTLATLVVTGFFRLNKIVAVGTSQLCMPPFVPALCIEMGYFFTHNGQFLTDISIETIGYQCLDRFYEWCLGSLVVAPVLGLLTFIILYFMASAIGLKPEEG